MNFPPMFEHWSRFSLQDKDAVSICFVFSADFLLPESGLARRLVHDFYDNWWFFPPPYFRYKTSAHILSFFVRVDARGKLLASRLLPKIIYDGRKSVPKSCLPGQVWAWWTAHDSLVLDWCLCKTVSHLHTQNEYTHLLQNQAPEDTLSLPA